MPARTTLLGRALDRPGIRVRTLVQLRWTAVLGQLVTLTVVGGFMGYPIPWVPAVAAVAASVSLNLGLAWLYRRQDRLEGRGAAMHLAFDLVQLAVLLYLTGGLANPFSLLLLVPVTVSATFLSGRATAVLVAIALVLLVPLWRFALPLPWPGDPMELPDTYRLGILVAIALGATFLAFYAWQVSNEARRRQQALVATQAALERETKMAALGSLAAAAAHELGGPLGTITLIARDLADSLGEDPDFGSDIALLNQEVTRSQGILRSIATRAEAEDPFPVLPLPALLREVVDPFLPTRVPVSIAVMWDPTAGPRVRRSAELLHGLRNLVGNALRHARGSVQLEAGEDPEEIWIAVADDGDGFPADLLPKLGEPFLGPSRSGSGSTGLGIFIATTLLERTGGRLAFSNDGGGPDGGGARVELRWRRADIEARQEQTT